MPVYAVLAPKEKFCACQGESVCWYWVAGDGLWIRVLETHDGRKLTWARATPLSLMVSPAPLRYPTRSEGPLRTTGGDGKRVSDVEGNPCTGWWRNGQQASTEHWRVEQIGCRNWCDWGVIVTLGELTERRELSGRSRMSCSIPRLVCPTELEVL
jgi:hypothetical protein